MREQTNKKLLILSLGCVLAACGSGDPKPGDTSPTDAGQMVEDFCPTELEFTVLAGSINNFGWTGRNHNRFLPTDAKFKANITQCDDSCRNCRFIGPATDPEENLTRCLIDTSQSCRVDDDCPFDHCTGDPGEMTCSNNRALSCTTDEDCGRSFCRVMIGPPSASPLNVTAIANAFQSHDALAGRIDLDTGGVVFDRFEIMIVAALGTREGSGYPQTCEGDDFRNDGIKNGICTPSVYGVTAPVEENRPCDAQGGAGWVGSRPGNYSLDCSMAMRVALALPGASISTTSAVDWVIDETQQPLCADGPCWCGLCEGTEDPCHSHSECDGQCMGIGVIADVEPQNNACDTECVWDSVTLSGRCEIFNPPDKKGNPVPNTPRACFPSGPEARMQVLGTNRRLDERTYSAEVGSLACTPKSESGQPTNGIAGLPGPQLARYRFAIVAK